MSIDRIFIGLVSIVAILLVLWSSDHIFFWDTVQFAGKHGSWYYDNGLLSGLLPVHLDSGHPPSFGMYLAGLWKLFGQSLEVAHWGMLPFLLLNIWYAAQLGQVVLQERYWLFVIGMFLCPFYLGHSILVSPDIVLVSGFLMCTYGILGKKGSVLIPGSILLALISVRGNVVLGGLILFHLVQRRSEYETSTAFLMRCIKVYMPAIFICVVYQVWHYTSSSWVGFHEDSPWAPSFEMVSSKGLLYNAGLYVWRLIDHGMIVIYVGLCLGLYYNRKIKEPLWLLVGLLVILLGLVTVPFTGLVNHRYYLPIQILVILLFLKLLSGKNTYLSLIFLLVMALGNLIIYPDRIAQGWDATAAHWPYYEVEEEMRSYINEETAIQEKEVGVAFPLWAEREFIDLEQNKEGYHKINFETDKYILYSNVMNDFSDEEMEILQNWSVIHTVLKNGVHMTLYKRP